MRIFEYGIRKDGRHPLSYVRGTLLRSDENLPMLAPDRGGAYRAIMGELHDVTDDDVATLDGLNTGYERRPMTTSEGHAVQVYVPLQPQGEIIDSGIWLFPRLSCDVFRATFPDGAEFDGSKREIVQQIAEDQWSPTPVRKLKSAIAERVRMLRAMEVRTDTIEEFFNDLMRADAMRVRKLWPRKGHEVRPTPEDTPLPF